MSIQKKKFKVITWNLNSIHARMERLQALLQKYQPDIICLQETKSTDDKFPESAITRMGYQSFYFGQKSYNGVAILTKDSSSKLIIKGLPTFHTDNSARFLGVQIADLRIYSAYIPNGQEVGSEKYSYKLAWMKNLKKFFEEEKLKTSLVLLVGDFNVALEDQDVYDPGAWRGKILFSEEEKKALSAILELGFTDCFRKLNPVSETYTWWDYRNLSFPKNHGLRIDLILASEILSQKCKTVSILREERKGIKPSDHAPVEADFDLT